MIARAFDSYPKCNPNLDVNCDGKMDIRDMPITAKNYGKTDP